MIGPDSPSWFQLGRDARARRLKLGHRRGIWVVELAGSTVYAKVSRLPKHSFRERLRIWMHLTPAEREWRTASAARLRRSPVIHFVALGVRGGGRPGTVLISEAIPQSRTLSDAWVWSRKLPESARRGTRLRLIDAVARMYADAHRAGLVHPDNHPQNIIVCRPAAECSGAWSAFFVDLPDAQLRPSAARRLDRVRTLAQLEHHFRRIATRTERLRFLRDYLTHYAQRSGSGQGPSMLSSSLTAAVTAETGSRLPKSKLRPWLAQIAAARADHAVKLARVRDRRLRGDGKYFARSRFVSSLGGDDTQRQGPAKALCAATVVLKLERRHVFPEPGTPDRTMDDWKGILAGHLPASRATLDPCVPATPGKRRKAATSRVGEEPEMLRGACQPWAQHDSHLHLIRYEPKNGWERLCWTLFGSPAERFFRHCHQLRHRDIPAPLPLAAITARRRGLIERVWLVLPASDAQENTRSIAAISRSR